MATYNCNTMQGLCRKSDVATVEVDICFDSLLRDDDSIASIRLKHDEGVTVALGTPPNPGRAVRVVVGGGTPGTLYRIAAYVNSSLGLIDERVVGVSVFSCD